MLPGSLSHPNCQDLTDSQRHSFAVPKGRERFWYRVIRFVQLFVTVAMLRDSGLLSWASDEIACSH